MTSTNICHMCYKPRGDTSFIVGTNSWHVYKKLDGPRMFCNAECLSLFYSNIHSNSIRYAKYVGKLSEALFKKNRRTTGVGHLSKSFRRMEKKADMMVRQEVSLGDVAEIIDETNEEVDTEVDTKQSEVDEMKVYEGKVKDGKIEVAEPDGTKAVLIFDTAPVVEAEPKNITLEPVKKEVKKSEPFVFVLGEQGKGRSRLYRHILGCSLLEYFRRLKASGFNGKKSEVLLHMRGKFVEAGYGQLFDSDKKMRLSMLAVMQPMGFALDKPYVSDGLATGVAYRSATGQEKAKSIPKGPKVYQASKLIINGPTNIRSRDLWVKILGTGVGAYLDRGIESGVQLETICDVLCKEIEKAGYKPNREAIMAELYVKKGMQYRG